MGRFVGWIGPIAYLVVVVAAALVGGGGHVMSYLSSPDPLADPSIVSTMSAAGASVYLLGPVLVVAWLAAILWFVAQAANLHADKLEDEKWSAHMLAVGFASRLLLAPLCVFCTLAALFFALGGIAGLSWGVELSANVLAVALSFEVLGILLTLPASLYQICAATRLANRGLLSPQALVGHVLCALLPTAGFMAMCGLYVNGRASLLAAHDARVAREALAAAAEKTDEESIA